GHPPRTTCLPNLTAPTSSQRRRVAYDDEPSGGRADECTGLENRRPASGGGLESLPLRQHAASGAYSDLCALVPTCHCTLGGLPPWCEDDGYGICRAPPRRHPRPRRHLPQGW